MNIFLHMTHALSQTEASQQERQEHTVVPYFHEENTNEGSEFLDGELRMVDQPLYQDDSEL
jgi:hypothetical protein